jgi:hypothetical protein
MHRALGLMLIGSLAGLAACERGNPTAEGAR